MNYRKFAFINDTVFLISINIDFIMISLNVTFGMRVVIQYFEFLTFISMYLMISMVFKMRLYLMIFNQRLSLEGYDLNIVQAKKFKFLMKFVFFSIFSVCLSFQFVTNYHFFLFLFSFPIIQIIYNSCHVLKKDCYKNEVHLLFFLP